MTRQAYVALCIVGVCFAAPGALAQPWNTNLLANPGGEAGDMSGWTIIDNGGNGWGATGNLGMVRSGDFDGTPVRDAKGRANPRTSSSCRPDAAPSHLTRPSRARATPAARRPPARPTRWTPSSVLPGTNTAICLPTMT